MYYKLYYIFVIIVIFLVFFVNKFISNKNANAFNHVFIINGDDYVKRYYRTIKILINDLNFSPRNIIRWPAVFPYDTTMQDRYSNYVCTLKKGALGCSMSHRSLWKHIYTNYKCKNWIFIFEDDIQLPINLSNNDISDHITNLLKKADEQNIDIIYLGHCFRYYCTHAYVIKPKSAYTLYKNTYDCIKYSPKPIDNQMSILRDKGIIKVMFASKFDKSRNSWSEGLIRQKRGESISKSHEKFVNEI